LRRTELLRNGIPSSLETRMLWHFLLSYQLIFFFNCLKWTLFKGRGSFIHYGTSAQKYHNIILRISLKVPWFTPNTEIHRETNTLTIKDFITSLTLNLHSRLPLMSGALFYNIGQTSLNSPTFKTTTITRRIKLVTNNA
jgi:hypothetical protein